MRGYGGSGGGGGESKLRIALVDATKCKPNKCGHECKRNCPVVRTGKVTTEENYSKGKTTSIVTSCEKLCIEVSRESKIAKIQESLCIGCGICVKKCPFHAISIINLPKDLHQETIHRYGRNSFKLHRLPTPRAGQVLGLVGTNGIGKSTALKILAAKIKPNLGIYIREEAPEWTEILTYFKGSELQNYFHHLLNNRLKCTTKPQYVEQIQKELDGKVGDILAYKSELGPGVEKKNSSRSWSTSLPGGQKGGPWQVVCEALEISHLYERELGELSGGELQRFDIAICANLDAGVYMFDEPSSYLDVKQRLAVSRVIRNLVHDNNFTLVVEHDLAVLDYLSDFICCLWGAPGVYGVVSMPSTVREGINIFLDGYLPSENLRFREVQLNFKKTVTKAEAKQHQNVERFATFPWGRLRKSLVSRGGKDVAGTAGASNRGFVLDVEPGNFCDSEILVLLGQNGVGKTTFIRMLAGYLKPDAPDENGNFNGLKGAQNENLKAGETRGGARGGKGKRVGDTGGKIGGKGGEEGKGDSMFDSTSSLGESDDEEQGDDARQSSKKTPGNAAASSAGNDAAAGNAADGSSLFRLEGSANKMGTEGGSATRREFDFPRMNVSYKPQTLSVQFPGTVEQLLRVKISEAFGHPEFDRNVMKPMLIHSILGQLVKTLSGGELQRLAIVLCLGKPGVDLYLLDEPSAYLDVEQRLVMAKVLKKFILSCKRTAIVVEHDFIVASYLADKVIVYEGSPGCHCTARAPETFFTGINRFLLQLEITLRRDPHNYRPRINKLNSARDKEQKAAGQYFILEE